MQTLMTTVADTTVTVLLSSHNVAELERVCDYLIVLTGGRVQVAGDIDDLLAEHRVLTGPVDSVVEGAGVIHVTRGDRHANVVARPGGATVLPGWESHPIGLEELVLAYLRRSRAADATSATAPEQEVRT